jgi:hypothetical protein
MVALMGVLALVALPHTRAQRILLYLVILSSPLLAYRQDVSGLIQLSPSRIFLLLGLLGFVLGGLARRRFYLTWDRWLTPALALLLIKTISLLYSDAQVSGVRLIGVFTEHVLYLYLVLALVQDRGRLKTATVVFLASAILPLGVAVFQFSQTLGGGEPTNPLQQYLNIREANARIGLASGGIGPNPWGLLRVASTFADPNTFGMFTALMASLTLPVFLRGRSRLLALGAAGLLAALLVGFTLAVSFSAVLTGLAVIIAFVGVLVLTRLGRGRSRAALGRLVVGSSLVTALVLAWTSLNPVPLSGPLTSRYANEQLLAEKGTFPGHSARLYRGLEVSGQALPWGLGEGLRFGSHNYFLDVLMSNGILGLAALLWFFGVQIRDTAGMIWRRRSDRAREDLLDAIFTFGSIPFIAGVMVATLIYDPLLLPWFWVGFGLIRAYQRLREAEQAALPAQLATAPGERPGL